MCDTMARVTSDGVLFAKNSDREPNEAQFLEWHPRRAFDQAARLKCTWIEIPQARRTYAVLVSRPYWMWGAEMGTNEFGVTIGNEAVFTRQPYARTGLTGMDLVRLALERSKSADEAVQTIVSLLEEFGQGGGCKIGNPRFTYHNSYVVADPRTALVLETAGRHYATEVIRGGRSISNGLTIPEFARRHSDAIKTYVAACRLRRGRTQPLVERAAGPGDLAEILRDHGDAHRAPRYRWLNGGLSAPCVHAGGLVASSQTTASWIAELRADRVLHWATATAAPCTGLFKPVAVSQPLELGRTPTSFADDESLWWRHERLHRAVLRDPARLLPRYARQRDEVERAWLADPPDSAEAFSQADRLLAQWTEDVLAEAGPDTRPGFVRRYWNRRNREAGLRFAATAPVAAS
jgi:dipeptidase